MLKKEHLLCRKNGDRIKPGFIAPDDPDFLRYAAGLIQLYRNGSANQICRHELLESSREMIRGGRNQKALSGMDKLLYDRCTFNAALEKNYPKWREELFELSARKLYDRILPEPMEEDIYGDLPDFEKMTFFKDITPEMLIHRFNMAQAQMLLMNAQKIDLHITCAENSELRKLLKTIKFFRLMGQFSSDGKNGINIGISGPYAIFDASSKYAMQLANLLPALALLPKWKLTAVTTIDRKNYTLSLSEKNALVSHYRNFSSYLPEEIKLFHRSFQNRSGEWQLVGETPFIDAGNQEIIFPDLSFYSSRTGKTFHLELFHRWHASLLDRHLEILSRNPELPLFIGIDRAIVKNDEILQSKCAAFPELQNRCFLFRDFPGVETTLRILKKLSGRKPLLSSHRFRCRGLIGAMLCYFDLSPDGG